MLSSNTSIVLLADAALLTPIDQIIIGFYLVAILVTGIVFSRFVKSSDDFFLAGKSLPFWAIGMSVVVSDIGAFDMVAGAGSAYKYGIAQANFDWIGSLPAMVIVAFVFVPFYWRSGVCTLPEFMGRRYGNAVRGLQAVIWLGFLVSMLGVMLFTSAKFLNLVVDIPTAQGIWVTAAIVGIYTVFGGLTAVVLTDVIQTVVMFVGAGALLVLSFWKIGGWSALVDTVTTRGPEFAEHFRLLLPNDTSTPYPWSGIVFGLGIVLSTAYFSSNQAVVQRVLGARSEWHAKAAMLFAGFLKLLIPILVILPGLCALALYPDLETADDAMPHLVRELLPPGLLGLVCAAFFAALMSSVDSFLNSTTTIIISDAYRPLYQLQTGQPASDKSCLWLGRGVTLVVMVSAGLLAPVMEKFETIYSAVQTAFSMFQGPTLAILTLGVFWKRANTPGALVGLVSGVLLATLFNWLGSDVFPSDDPFLFVSFWTFVWTLVVTSVVSALTRPPPLERIEGLVWRATKNSSQASGGDR